MTPVIPCTVGNAALIPVTAFSIRKNNSLTILSSARKSVKHGSSAQRLLLPLPGSIGLFPHNKTRYSFHQKSRTPKLLATGTDVAVEEPDSPVADEDSAEASETASDEVGTSEDSSPQSDANLAAAKAKRSRPARKSEMPSVKNEDLIPGATFTGKVKSIQPFGAFVDFGAFTDGLVHVSQLSDNYVKDVGSVVSIGQEVKVKLIEVNTETQRISLSMRESDDTGRVKQRKDAPVGTEKAVPGRRNTPKSSLKKDDVKKSTVFVKGQYLEGTVKNMTRSGAFIALPEGEEGFLPISEELDEGFENVMGNTSLQVGQEVSVRVLRINRGQVTLTMKKEEEDAALDSELSQGVVYTATNPFVLAFRKNKDVASFLDEREKMQNPVGKPSTQKTKDETKGTVKQEETKLDVPDAKDETESSKQLDGVPSAVETSGENDVSESVVDVGSSGLVDASAETVGEERVSANISSAISGMDNTIEKEAKVTSEGLAPGKGDIPTEDPIIEETTQTETMTSNVKTEDENVRANNNVLEDEKQLETPNAVEEIANAVPSDNDDVEPNPGENGSTTGSDSDITSSSSVLQETAGLYGSTTGSDSDITSSSSVLQETADRKESDDQIVLPESPSTETVENIVNSSEEVHAPPAEIEISSASQIVETVEAAPENNDRDTDASREISVLTSEGILNTDRKDSDDQVVLPESPNTETVENIFNSSKEVHETTAERGVSSASQIDEKIEVAPENIDLDTDTSGEISVSSSGGILNADGKEDNAQVLSPESQPSEVVKNSVDNPEEVEKQSPATENDNSPISLVEEKEVGIASEESSSSPSTNGQIGVAASEQGSSKATVSPALVKQLREETGAGMMDCKKALAETEGDIIKAQELLRKKGLASAEKKASRVTAEGRIGSYIHDSRIGILVEVNCETDFVSRGEIFKELVDDLAMQVAACAQVQYLVTEDVPEEIVNKEKEIEMQKEDLLSKPEQIRSKIVEGRIRKRLEELALLEQPYIKNDKVAVKDWVKQTIATVGENIKVKRFVRFNLGEGLEKKSQDFAAEVAAQTAAKPVPAPVKEQPTVAEAKETEQKPSTVVVSAALVKQLREETGAGMMDCKKALAETGGDLEKAQEYLRKKGLSSAEKKSSRLAAEGRIGSYIHDSRIGVLIEVNCETDFVGRSDKFKELVDDLAMQVVGCPQVQFVSIDDIPESIVNKEKELEMQREDLLSKPENIRERIVEGRISKRLGELSLLEQPFIKDDSVLVKDLVKQTVAAIGENIRVRRFVRFTLGETTETEETAAA